MGKEGGGRGWWKEGEEWEGGREGKEEGDRGRRMGRRIDTKMKARGTYVAPGV